MSETVLGYWNVNLWLKLSFQLSCNPPYKYRGVFSKSSGNVYASLVAGEGRAALIVTYTYGLKLCELDYKRRATAITQLTPERKIECKNSSITGNPLPMRHRRQVHPVASLTCSRLLRLTEIFQFF